MVSISSSKPKKTCEEGGELKMGSQKYGIPIYGASWIPKQNRFEEETESTHQQQSPSSSSPLLVFCGGGGEGRSGIPNSLLIAQFDSNSSTLSPDPGLLSCAGSNMNLVEYVFLNGFVLKLRHCEKNWVLKRIQWSLCFYDLGIVMGSHGFCQMRWRSSEPVMTYRIEWQFTQVDKVSFVRSQKVAVVRCSHASFRWFEWDEQNSAKSLQLGLKSSEKVLTQLEDVGQQLALTFNHDGSILAVGGEDGHLRVFKWPNMDIILDDGDAHSTVKDLSFSFDGKLLVSLGSDGPPRVWDVESSKVVASLSKENDEIFGFCRFSQTANNDQILYITTTRGERGNIVYWDTASWKRIGSKRIVKDRITAFNVSSDGKFLAVGTNEGDIVIVKSSNMHVHATVKKAHLVVVTSMMFSPDSRSLVSASIDSSARVTRIEDEQKHNGLNEHPGHSSPCSTGSSGIFPPDQRSLLPLNLFCFFRVPMSSALRYVFAAPAIQSCKEHKPC
ncbi:hypothetical protein Syun_022126 [Stephania yunnanensis]|uniref:Anaphase-promoting complex subunit 4-like WD40 domain-containing protein n=1 Tax=Stephania yunnanensis TaxID=152371 RepID=A0AAP0NRB0_9MAGN